MNFSELVGQKILVHTTITKLEDYIQGGSTAIVELVGVESGGIWVKHEGLQRDLGKLASSQVVIRGTPKLFCQLGALARRLAAVLRSGREVCFEDIMQA